jgi:hypothetical protein
MTSVPAPVFLDEAQAQFITRRVAINLASCDATRTPSVSRAFGCRVSPDRREVTVFLAVPYATAVLADLRRGAAVAVVFTLPSTHETLQLKGAGAKVVPLADGDRELMRAYGKSFHDELDVVGHHDPFASAIVAGVEEEAVGVSFTLTAAFEQTPGPNAGRPLLPQP